MNAEIRYSEESVPQPGAIRVLMQGGQWLAPEQERPADWREREQPVAFSDPAPRIQWPEWSSVKAPRPPRRSEIAKRKVKPVKPIKAAKPERTGQQRGKGWNRIAGLTLEAILGWQREGLTLPQMAERSGFKLQTIADRMREGRLNSPEYLAAFNALRLCRCGNQKFTRNAVCAACAKRERRKGQVC